MNVVDRSDHRAELAPFGAIAAGQGRTPPLRGTANRSFDHVRVFSRPDISISLGMDKPSPGPPPPPGRHRPGLSAIVVAVLLLAGVVVFFIVDRPQPAKTGRGDGSENTSSFPTTGRSPDEALDEYLRYRLVERSDADASPLLCRTPNLTAFDSYVADIKSRESQFRVKILSTWGVFNDGPTSDGKTNVSLDLTKEITGYERTSDAWTFVLSDENGWKVCHGQTASAP